MVANAEQNIEEEEHRRLPRAWTCRIRKVRTATHALVIRLDVIRKVWAGIRTSKGDGSVVHNAACTVKRVRFARANPAGMQHV